MSQASFSLVVLTGRIQFQRNENRDRESHWRDPAGPLGAVGSLCTRAGAIPGYAVERALPKEVITLPAAARPPTSHRNFNSCRSYMLIQNQNRFPTALLAVRRIPKIHIRTRIYIYMSTYVYTCTQWWKPCASTWKMMLDVAVHNRSPVFTCNIWPTQRDSTFNVCRVV